MRKLLLSVFTLAALSVGAQNVFNEDFNYTAAQALTANNWTQIGTSTTNPISVTSSGLTYTGFTNSGVGNAAALTTTGQDVLKDASMALSSGDVYLSFMLNVSAAQATGDYFLAFLPSGNTSNFFGRFFAKSSSTGYVLGISKWTDAVTYGTTMLNFNTTYYVVVKYSFVSATTADDQATVYVFSSGIPSTEPSTTYAGPTASVAADQANIGRIALRQGNASNAATLVIDGIRLSTTWGATILPVQLSALTATRNDLTNEIKWTTVSEKNNRGFEIQRSVNGGKFTAIGFVKGVGNSNSPKNYSFTDADVNTGNVCYRLKQLDYSGETELSKTVCVQVNPTRVTNEVITTPNPFNGVLHVKYNSTTDGNIHVELMDLLGKTYLQQNQSVNKGDNALDLNTEVLPVGVYFIRINNGNEVISHRIIKR